MKRHLNTHARRRSGRPTPVLETTTTVIEVQEAGDGSESIVPDGDVGRTDSQNEADVTETSTDATVQYTRDPLESVREGVSNTLYVVPLLIA